MAFKGVCFYRVFFALLVSFVPCLPSTAAGVTQYPTRTTARPLRAMLVSTSALRQTTTKPKTIPSSTSKPTTISPRFGTIPVAKTPGPRLPETKPHNTYHSTARETKHSTKATTHRLRAMPSSTSDFRQMTTKLRTIPSSTSTPTTTLRRSQTRLYDSFKLRLPTDNSNTITVEKGVESNVDFYLNDYPSLNTQIRIIVQHKRGSGAFDRKCQILHSKTYGCSVQIGPCQCLGEGPGSSFGYRLKMIFTSQDAGLLQVEIVNYDRISITLNVREAVSTTFKPTRAPITVARPATTRLPTIPTSTPTTVMTTLLVEAVTHTTPHKHHTPGPHHIETPNSVDSDDNEETGDDNESLSSQSEKDENPYRSSQSEKEEDDGGDNNSSSGLGSVAMYTIIISFLVIASLWGLV